MKLPLPQKTLREYMAQYATEHTKLGTKVTHMIGIPMVVASVPAGIVSPPIGGGLFVGGWALQFIGHAAFERNKPAFFGDPYYLLVGPVWAAVEWLQLFRLPVPEALRPAEGDGAAASHANDEAVAAA
jgi:uncharacterized membrane protein YGL010W